MRKRIENASSARWGGQQPSAGAVASIATIDGDTLAELLAFLPPETVVPITIGDLRIANERRFGGPEIMSTRQAAEFIGWSARRWREWAEAGLVAGAKRDEKGDWRLPRSGCRARMQEEMSSGRKPPPLAAVSATGTAMVAVPRVTDEPRRSVRRGPRKPAARQSRG
jgi:hypothetical protein